MAYSAPVASKAQIDKLGERLKTEALTEEAVHVIPSVDGMPVEVQVRTALQHLWAELSEKFSDVLDPGDADRMKRQVEEILRDYLRDNLGRDEA